jgi:hypothetical protein
LNRVLSPQLFFLDRIPFQLASDYVHVPIIVILIDRLGSGISLEVINELSSPHNLISKKRSNNQPPNPCSTFCSTMTDSSDSPPDSTAAPDLSTPLVFPPSFSTSLPPLSLSLTRDQGTLHASGTGAGSEMASLSDAAHSQHAAIAPIVLSYSSSFKAVHAAMNPNNLPKAPTELPTLVVVKEGTPNGGRSEINSGASTTANSTDTSSAGTPTQSRSPSPPPSKSVSPGRSAATSPTLSASALLSPATATTASAPKRPGPPEKGKSVFGKLFERNNASSGSLSSSSTPAVTPVPTTAANTPSPPNGTDAAPVALAAGGAALARKVSKKEKEKEDKAAAAKDKEAGRPRAESNGYLSSTSANEKWGMGAALNEFMRNKVARKSSQNSKKSDDGKSDRGKSDHAKEGEGSAFGGSSKGDREETKSKSGMTTTSTLKKYGVCEKVLIGKGATAVVKLAHKWDRTTERLYAVKVRRHFSLISLSSCHPVTDYRLSTNRNSVNEERTKLRKSMSRN